MGTLSFREGWEENAEDRGLSSFLLLYSTPPRPCVQTELGRPWELGLGHRHGAQDQAEAPTQPEVAEYSWLEGTALA